MAKRKSKDVVLCCNVAVLSKKGSADTRISNSIYSFSPDDTWYDVLGDLLHELDYNYRLGNSDSVEVCLSSKKDYNEKIDVISQFILYILCDIKTFNKAFKVRLKQPCEALGKIHFQNIVDSKWPSEPQKKKQKVIS